MLIYCRYASPFNKSFFDLSMCEQQKIPFILYFFAYTQSNSLLDIQMCENDGVTTLSSHTHCLLFMVLRFFFVSFVPRARVCIPPQKSLQHQRGMLSFFVLLIAQCMFCIILYMHACMQSSICRKKRRTKQRRKKERLKKERKR